MGPEQGYEGLSEEVPLVQGVAPILKPRRAKNSSPLTCECIHSVMDTHRVLIQTLPASLGDHNEPT